MNLGLGELSLKFRALGLDSFKEIGVRATGHVLIWNLGIGALGSRNQDRHMSDVRWKTPYGELPFSPRPLRFKKALGAGTRHIEVCVT